GRRHCGDSYDPEHRRSCTHGRRPLRVPRWWGIPRRRRIWRRAHGRLWRRIPRWFRRSTHGRLRRRLSHCTLRQPALRRLPGRLLPPPPVLHRSGWLGLCVVLALAARPVRLAPRVGLRPIPILVLTADGSSGDRNQLADRLSGRDLAYPRAALEIAQVGLVADLGDHAPGKRAFTGVPGAAALPTI